MNLRLTRNGSNVLLDGEVFAVAKSDAAATALIISMKYVLDSYRYMKPHELDLIEEVLDPLKTSERIVNAIGPIGLYLKAEE